MPATSNFSDYVHYIHLYGKYTVNKRFYGLIIIGSNDNHDSRIKVLAHNHLGKSEGGRRMCGK